jgi:hypothetical protein
VLRIDERLRTTTQVTLVAPAQEDRVLLVEIQKRPQATLVPDPALPPTEETAGAWRFELSLKAGERRTLSVRQDRIVRQSVALLEGEQAIARVLGLQGLDPAARTALQRLVDLRAARATRDAEVEKLEAQTAEIETDQERVRRNLAAVPATDALHGRLLRQLEALETRMQALRRSQEQARTAAEQAQRDLEAAIGRLAL